MDLYILLQRAKQNLGTGISNTLDAFAQFLGRKTTLSVDSEPAIPDPTSQEKPETTDINQRTVSSIKQKEPSVTQASTELPDEAESPPVNLTKAPEEFPEVPENTAKPPAELLEKEIQDKPRLSNTAPERPESVNNVELSKPQPLTEQDARKQLINNHLPHGEVFEEVCNPYHLKPLYDLDLRTIAAYQKKVAQLTSNPFTSHEELAVTLKSEMVRFIQSAAEFKKKKADNPWLDSSELITALGYPQESTASSPAASHDYDEMKAQIMKLFPAPRPNPFSDEEEPAASLDQDNMEEQITELLLEPETNFYLVEGDYLDGDSFWCEALDCYNPVISRITRLWHPWEGFPELPIIEQSPMGQQDATGLQDNHQFAITLSQAGDDTRERINTLLSTLPAFSGNKKGSLAKFQEDMQTTLEKLCDHHADIEEVSRLTREEITQLEHHLDTIYLALTQLPGAKGPDTEKARHQLKLQQCVLDQYLALVPNYPWER